MNLLCGNIQRSALSFIWQRNPKWRRVSASLRGKQSAVWVHSNYLTNTGAPQRRGIGKVYKTSHKRLFLTTIQAERIRNSLHQMAFLFMEVDTSRMVNAKLTSWYQ